MAAKQSVVNEVRDDEDKMEMGVRRKSINQTGVSTPVSNKPLWHFCGRKAPWKKKSLQPETLYN